MFFEEIASRYRSLNSVFSVIEFCFSSDYPSMWFEVRRFNCCPTFVQIISERTKKDFLFFHQSWSSDCYCLQAVIAWRMLGCIILLRNYSWQRLRLSLSVHNYILSKCIYTSLYCFDCVNKLWARKMFYVICTGDYNTGFLDWCPLTSAAITLLPNTLQYRFQILHWEI